MSHSDWVITLLAMNIATTINVQKSICARDSAKVVVVPSGDGMDTRSLTLQSYCIGDGRGAGFPAWATGAGTCG